MKIPGIYKIQSKIKPERCYIGSSVSLFKRWKEHINELTKRKHPNKKLQFHFNKYGIADLEFSMVIGCDEVDLLKVEQYFIDAYNPWFNNSPTAGNNYGVRASKETKEKLRESHKGYKWSEESKKRLSATNKGKKKPDGFSEKLRLANIGKRHSEETKRKISLNKKGNKYMLGHRHTEEAKVKIREARAKQVFSEESRKKKSESLKIAWSKRKLNKAS